MDAQRDDIKRLVGNDAQPRSLSVGLPTGAIGGEPDGRSQFRSLPTKPLITGHSDGKEVFRSFAGGQTLFAQRPAEVGPQAGFAQQAQKVGMGWAPASASSEWATVDSKPAQTVIEQPFSTPAMQPFYEDVTVTQFESDKPPEQIFQYLMNAMRNRNCMYSVDREAGSIKLASLVDHSRVEATVRVYSRPSGRHLVHYGRTFGDRIPATRLFFTLVNNSGLLEAKLELPRLLRRSERRDCCTRVEKEEQSETEDPLAAMFVECDMEPKATVVFVEMLSSTFIEEALVGAQSLARACCCTTSSKPYVPYLPDIVEALCQHQASGCAGHLVCRDIVPCLAHVIELVTRAALTESLEVPSVVTALEPMLRCAAQEGGDPESARASLRAVAELCALSQSIKTKVLEDHRSLVNDALHGKGPCSLSTSGDVGFLVDAARSFQQVLGLC